MNWIRQHCTWIQLNATLCFSFVLSFCFIFESTLHDYACCAAHSQIYIRLLYIHVCKRERITKIAKNKRGEKQTTSKQNEQKNKIKSTIKTEKRSDERWDLKWSNFMHVHFFKWYITYRNNTVSHFNWSVLFLLCHRKISSGFKVPFVLFRLKWKKAIEFFFLNAVVGVVFRSFPLYCVGHL